MQPAMMKAEALERRQAERRKAHAVALAVFYGDADRRSADRRASDSAMVCAWIRRFDALRGGKA